MRNLTRRSSGTSGSRSINAQLINAETDAHLWAERFDGDTSDLFTLQNEITSRIAIALRVELIRAEAARRTERPDVLEYILRSRAAGAGPPTRSSLAERIGWLERALALDPGSTEAQSWLAANLAGRVLANMTDSAAADIGRAKGLTEQALAASPHSPLGHYAKGQVLRAQHLYAEAIPEYETVLASNRNWVYAFFALGQCRLYTGSIEETIPLVEQAIRLSPRDPSLGIWYETIGLVHLLRSRMAEAIIWLERARSANPEHPAPHARLASAHALKGETERATAELAEARRLARDDRFSSLGRLRAALGYWGVPSVHALFEATYFAGLRKAGMPEE